jgi:DNA helicase-2/ATP-dependent DNA helicase PcrA
MIAMTTNILSNLNPKQREAVETVEGPLLIVAGPGSGKTRVITHRIAYLARVCGVTPHRIAAVTFTNKAAREMRERLVPMMGAGIEHLTVGTFHAFCASILRREGERIGLDRNFAIYDDDDQITLIKRSMEEVEVDPKRFSPRAIQSAISNAKSQLLGVEGFALKSQSYLDEVVRRVYERYDQLLGRNSAVDFDDLLMKVYLLFQNDPKAASKYQERYVHFMIDEFQDTNVAQYAIAKQIAQANRNLCVVGDPDQCLPPGTPIRTPEGVKPIEEVRIGDRVLAAAGRGKTIAACVTRVHCRPYQGKLVEVKTRRGYILRATPNHMFFARLGLRADVHYVYLMYRAAKGYRIGICVGGRSDGYKPGLSVGLLVRNNQEHGDKVWVLRVCASRQEAVYYEQYYAFTYGIPTTAFHDNGRGLTNLSQEIIDKLFASVDTATRARRLMDDMGLFFDYPHHRAQGIGGDAQPHRQTVHLTLFGHTVRSEKSPWYGHRVALNTKAQLLKQRLLTSGIKSRAGARGTWRIERYALSFQKACALAEQLAEAGGGLDIARWAMLTAPRTDDSDSIRFAFQPAAHLHPSVVVPVEAEGVIEEDEIEQVNWYDYEGLTYDLDVEPVHNYIAGGIVVHNSIYSWRHADIRNILSFQDDFKDAKVVPLEQNYRSTQTILDAAKNLIAANTQRVHKDLWTDNGRGVPIVVAEGYNEEEEAQLVVREIQALIRVQGTGYRVRGDNPSNPEPRTPTPAPYKLGDIAVMYRVNAQSRALEEACLRYGVPYQVVGGLKFYQRQEVKDVIAYLRLVANPHDDVSLTRVINTPPRGIGQRTLDELTRMARDSGVSMFSAIEALAGGQGSGVGDRRTLTSDPRPLTPRSAQALISFHGLIKGLIAESEKLDLIGLIDLTLERSGYRRYILEEAERGEERWENIQEFKGSAKDYLTLGVRDGLTAFLESVSLVSDVDHFQDKPDAITLITLHQAKGLEFPVVFIVGMEDGLLPHLRSMDDPMHLEEERRLCYVGMTRAKERLYLLRAFRRGFRGGSEPGIPSRFLADIPRELIAPLGQTRAASSGRYASTSERTPPSSDVHEESRERPMVRHSDGSIRVPGQRRGARKPAQAPFAVGDKVRHATFGEGIVMDCKSSGDDFELTVAFREGGGIKRLLLSFAKLEKA